MPGSTGSQQNIETEIAHFVENFKMNCPDWNEHYDRVATGTTGLKSPPDYLIFSRSISSYSKHSTTSTLPSSSSSNSIGSRASTSLLTRSSFSDHFSNSILSSLSSDSDRLSRIFMFDSQLFETSSSDGASIQSGKFVDKK